MIKLNVMTEYFGLLMERSDYKRRVTKGLQNFKDLNREYYKKHRIKAKKRTKKRDKKEHTWNS